MEIHNYGSILLDISLALMLIGVIFRLILCTIYFKRNGNRKLTPSQADTLKKIQRLILLPAIALTIVSIIVTLCN